MFRFFFAIATAFACTAVSAHQLTVSAADTVRLGNKIIAAGDKRARVIDAGGEPIYTRRVEFGERLVYRNGPNGHIVVALDLAGVVVWVAAVVGQVNPKDVDTRP